MQTTQNHIRFVFASVDINQCVTIAWHVDVSIVVCTLIDNGEFATHVVKLLSIVVKNLIHTY